MEIVNQRRIMLHVMESNVKGNNNSVAKVKSTENVVKNVEVIFRTRPLPYRNQSSDLGSKSMA